jgi:hypothetical protein
MFAIPLKRAQPRPLKNAPQMQTSMILKGKSFSLPGFLQRRKKDKSKKQGATCQGAKAARENSIDVKSLRRCCLHPHQVQCVRVRPHRIPLSIRHIRSLLSALATHLLRFCKCARVCVSASHPSHARPRPPASRFLV